MITSTESMRYLAKYTDKNGEIHKKRYATEAEAEAVYHLLHRMAKKHGISNIQVLDCKYCCQFFGGSWD